MHCQRIQKDPLKLLCTSIRLQKNHIAKDTNLQSRRRDNAKFSIQRTVRNYVKIFKLHTNV